MNRRRMLIGTLIAGLAQIVPLQPLHAAEQSPSDIVSALYKMQAAAQNKGPQPYAKGQREKFFNRRLVGLLAADDKLAAKEGVGRLDFDPFYDGQDFTITALQVGPAAVSSDTARLVVNYRNFGKPQKLTYELIREADAWRISNIFSENTEIKWDLVSILTRKMPAN
jgi:Protein of unknown function (DUF3828)